MKTLTTTLNYEYAANKVKVANTIDNKPNVSKVINNVESKSESKKNDFLANISNKLGLSKSIYFK